MKRAELLAPAGNMEKMKMAFHYGADAVYLGGKVFNLRAGSHNFTEEELIEAVQYAHSKDKTVWVTLNIIPHDHETAGLVDYIKFLDEIKVDGVIVADLGVFQMVQENSNLAISVSTQSSNTNWRSVQMWNEMGAKRVVLARENSLENIALIREKVPGIEIEVFIHGAMCMSVSGRCLLSNYMTARDANRGDCAQSCRWKYSIVEGGKDNEGEYNEVLDGDEPTHIFSSKDLCTIEIIDKILDLGVDSLKIEGRMKGIYYVSNVVRSYREALDSYYSGEFKYDPKWLTELETISHRKYTTGFYFGQPDSEAQNYNNRNSYSQSHQLVAKVIGKVDENTYILAVRNRIFSGEKLEVISNTGEPKVITLPQMTQIKGSHEEEVEVSHPNTTVRISLDADISELDMVRRVLPEEKE